MTDQVVHYNTLAGGNYAAGTNITWPGGGIGELVTVVEETGTTGKLYFTRLAGGDGPQNGETITQGGVTSSADGNAEPILYPIWFRQDVAIAANGDITWTGPALGATHSCLFDGQTANLTVGQTLTFSGGQTAELISQVDNGATGEIFFRMISNTDAGLPQDNDTFSDEGTGDGAVNGVVHERAYTPLHLHRLLADLNDDESQEGNDFLSIVDPTPSDRSTDQIVSLLGAVNISDTVAQHMYGGSISQASGGTKYSGLDIQVTTPLASTRPVVIQNDAIITDYWNNAYNPDSIAGKVRIMVKTRENGVDIDGRRVKGKLLEYGESYFEGGTTLGDATTALALFSSSDGNNTTAVGTVAGAPYNSIVITEGYQLIDFNNGNGSTPYALSFDLGTATKLQAYERWKYIQRRGTAETLFGRNAQLATGVIRNFAYDNESGNFSEDEIFAWGTEVSYTGESGGPFTLGEVCTFGNSTTGRLIYIDDQGLTGQMIFDMEGTTAPSGTITGVNSGATANTNVVTFNASSGTGLLMALDDGGTTGNFYYQALTGLDPVDNQTVYGATSLQTADVNGAVATRTINNAFVGIFTGSDFQTNFGIALDPSDATANDQLPNLLGVVQQPPNNQQGQITGLVVGDRVAVYPWDGVATDVNGDAAQDFDQMQLAVALTAGVSTVVNVGAGNIPNNTPQVGVLRIARDSDGQFDHVPYSSHDGDDEFTLTGTAPSAAAISNNLYIGYIDKAATSTTESYTAVFGPTSQQVAITVRRGGVNPIRTFKTTATFGATGFVTGAIRTPDA